MKTFVQRNWRLSPELVARVQAAADREGISETAWAARALEQALAAQAMQPAPRPEVRVRKRRQP